MLRFVYIPGPKTIWILVSDQELLMEELKRNMKKNPEKNE